MPENNKKSLVAIGIAMMVVSMLVVPVVDGIAKYMSSSFSPLMVSWVRYCGGVAFTLPLTLAIYRRQAWPAQDLPSQCLRTLFLIGAMTLFFIAISQAELADVTAAYLVAPILASILAVIVLKEPMTLRKALAVAVGFIGALIIVRPGASMDAGVVMGLAAGFLFACYVVATRKASQTSAPLVTLNFQYMLGCLLLMPAALWSGPLPASDWIGLILLMGLISVTVHQLSIAAFRYAQASTLAPLIYFEMIGATVVGWWMFGDLPDSVTWIGLAIVIIGALLLVERTGKNRS